MDKEDQEQGTNVPTTTPFVQTEGFAIDYDHDHALALSLQQQEGEVTMLETGEDDETEDDEDGEESYLSSSSTDSDDGIFFTSQELAELELLDQEEQEDMELEEEIVEEEVGEEDEVDPDELSYEDLVALGETVGQENQGLSPEEISLVLTPYICKSIHSNAGVDRCVICQIEYEEGENLVSLRCEHPFHGDCINQWLQIKKICPICSKEAMKQKTE